LKRIGLTGKDENPSRAVLHSVFGHTLRAVRKEQGISQEVLGHESGAGRTYVGQLERGERGPSLWTIFRLAPHLGVTPSEIIHRVETAFTPEA
jgi:transcriptional regulator with XRE-family HTH domain